MKQIRVLICVLLVCTAITACIVLPLSPLSPQATRGVLSSTLPVELIWTLSLDGRVTQSPLVTKKWAAIVTQHSLYLVDIATGEVQWQLPNHTYPYELPMVAVQDSLVIGEFGGVVSSLDVATGQLQWQTQISNDETANFNNVIVVADLIIVATQPTEIKALSPLDGAVQWEISSPLLYEMRSRGVHIYAYNGEVYIADLETYIVDARTGKLENVVDLKTNLMQSAGDYLFDHFGAYDIKTLTYQFNFRVPTGKYPISSCEGLQLPYTIEHNTVIAADSCGGTYAVDLTNGQVEWEYMPKLIAAPPIAVRHDVVYALMQNGEIHAIALNTGRNMGILKTNAGLAGYTEGELTSIGMVTNGEVLIATFNEPTVFGFSLIPD
jgi:outer membrane protein assembly factor BamB